MDKKHVLLIVENNSIPRDVRVWREAQAIKKMGHMVSVISPGDEKFNKPYENLDGINIYRYPHYEFNFGKLSFVIEYLIALIWQFLVAFSVYIKKPFHIIHGANPPDTICIIAFIFKLAGVKYIFDIHDLAPELFLSKFEGKKTFIYRTMIFLEKISCYSAHKIICTNNSYKSIIAKRHKRKPEDIYIVRNDPLKDACVDTGEKKHNDKAEILFIGCINSQDGVDILLQSLYKLIHTYKQTEWTCTIVGDGESIGSVKELAKELQLSSFITFTGFIFDRNTINYHLQSADICVEPAPENHLNRHSTFIKIMEYMSVGKPIIAFDLKETRYSSGNSSILVPPGDIDGFTRGIQQLLTDPGLRNRLGQAGQNKIKNELNWENAVHSMKQAYESLHP